ncbi:uncharacterized protein LOC141910187 [Tubulanus polymorphus]|uniref:uncharacterized protein LOC141910187 n=1 Tax=Tubulanus polymorphus TaxID=672921 RepID=UPI003DA38D7C
MFNQYFYWMAGTLYEQLYQGDILLTKEEEKIISTGGNPSTATGSIYVPPNATLNTKQVEVLKKLVTQTKSPNLAKAKTRELASQYDKHSRQLVRDWRKARKTLIDKIENATKYHDTNVRRTYKEWHENYLKDVQNIVRKGLNIQVAKTKLKRPNRFFKRYMKNSCFSHVGITYGRQQLNLNPECLYYSDGTLVPAGTILHELMHTVGFYHEHTRPDRDDYIRINWDAIQKDKEEQFLKWQDSITNGFEYDFRSVMHYILNAFAKNSDVNTMDIIKTNGTAPLYWCSTKQSPTHDNIEWGYCLFGSAETLSTKVLTTSGESCHFPFYYKGKRYDFCTSVDWRSMWCSLNETFDGYWGSCALPYGGAWSSWGEWSACDKTCGGGQRSRIRLCDNPVPINGGPTCPGDGFEHQPCQTVECPISGETFVHIGCFEDVGWPPLFTLLENRSSHLDGEFADRTDKLRKCALAAGSLNYNVVGLRAGGMCLAENLTVETLRDMTPSTACGNEGTGGENAMDVYALDEVLLAPDWSAWQAFTACSKTCGTGTRTRTRQCWDPKDLAFVDPTLCGGSETESESCSTELCPIDGVWGSWSEWSTCTSGIKYRSRLCDNPPPSNGGAQCPGEATNPLLC